MGNQAENSCRMPNGRVVGYGLLAPGQRSGYWRVRFNDKGRRVELSTGAETKGEARTRADAIVRDYFFPSAAPASAADWDEALAELAGLPHLRPASVKSYAKAVRAFRRVVPSPAGPAAVTADHAVVFARKYRPKSANTVRTALRHLKSLWKKHFKALGLVAANPWSDVPPPPPVHSTPRAPTREEVDEFFAYLDQRYPDWELIKLFVRTKGYLGCRTMDLCRVESSQLYGGRLAFTAAQTKTRVARSIPIPSELYAALDRLKGGKYLWERYAADAAVYRPNQNKAAPMPFTPDLLYWGVGNVFSEYNRTRPGKPRLRPHDLRRSALTTAAMAHGEGTAAAAIGVDPQTARRYYIDGAQAHDAEAVYASLAEWWRLGGGSAKTPGAGPAEKTRKACEK